MCPAIGRPMRCLPRCSTRRFCWGPVRIGHVGVTSPSGLFENLNQRFYRTSKVDKFITAVYGEISEDASFRFLLAGHPPPIVFSAANGPFHGSGP